MVVVVVVVCVCVCVGGGGGDLFSLYTRMYIENFKNLLVRNHRIDFIITWQNVSLVTLYQDCSSNCDLSKTWLLGGGADFPYIICIEN